MTLDVSIRVENLDKVADALARLSGPQARGAYAKALNDAGFQARREMGAALRQNFVSVTPWIERSPKVFPATPDRLSVRVAPTLSTTNAPGRGGKVGVDPQDVLQAQEFGGRRADKKSEAILRRGGWLQPGYQTAIPSSPFPGSDDGRGNIKGSFIRSVLSYLQAFSEQGNYQNMRAAARSRVEKGGSKKQVAQQGPRLARKYFVAGGRNAVTWDNKKFRSGAGATKHLQPGIWASLGSGAARQLRPVLIFVRAPSYRPRISMDKIVKQADLQNYLDKRVRFRVREAAGV
jgi:hypothetical protein